MAAYTERVQASEMPQGYVEVRKRESLTDGSALGVAVVLVSPDGDSTGLALKDDEALELAAALRFAVQGAS